MEIILSSSAGKTYVKGRSIEFTGIQIMLARSQKGQNIGIYQLKTSSARDLIASPAFDLSSAPSTVTLSSNEPNDLNEDPRLFFLAIKIGFSNKWKRMKVVLELIRVG